LVFITEMKSVYSAVRTWVFKYSSLCFVFKGLIFTVVRQIQK
jgi:hypothetical protein